jgi:hypothetical protein
VSRELFPRSPGSNLKIVVAARDMAHRTRATWYRDLGFERRQTCDLELEGLSQAAVRDLLQRMGNPLDTGMSRQYTANILMQSHLYIP